MRTCSSSGVRFPFVLRSRTSRSADQPARSREVPRRRSVLAASSPPIPSRALACAASDSSEPRRGRARPDGAARLRAPLRPRTPVAARRRRLRLGRRDLRRVRARSPSAVKCRRSLTSKGFLSLRSYARAAGQCATPSDPARIGDPLGRAPRIARAPFGLRQQDEDVSTSVKSVQGAGAGTSETRALPLGPQPGPRRRPSRASRSRHGRSAARALAPRR